MSQSLAAKASKEKTSEQGYGQVGTHAQGPASAGVHGDVLNLQRSAGNRAVSRVLKSGADNLPERMSGIPAVVHKVLRSSGQPLDPQTQVDMESRFGYDFSRVRVHTDAKAVESTQEVNALAYTVGNNIVFGAGRYVPGTDTAMRLLAHELTHVVQQARATTMPRQKLSAPSDAAEVEAETSSVNIGRLPTCTKIGATPVGLLQRKKAAPSGAEPVDLNITTRGPMASPGELRPEVDTLWDDTTNTVTVMVEGIDVAEITAVRSSLTVDVVLNGDIENLEIDLEVNGGVIEFSPQFEVGFPNAKVRTKNLTKDIGLVFQSGEVPEPIGRKIIVPTETAPRTRRKPSLASAAAPKEVPSLPLSPLEPEIRLETIAEVAISEKTTVKEVFREGIRQRFSPISLSDEGVDEVVQGIIDSGIFIGDPNAELQPGVYPVVLGAHFTETLQASLEERSQEDLMATTDRQLGLREGSTRQMMEWQRREIARMREAYFDAQEARRQQIIAEIEAKKIEKVRAQFRVAGAAVEYAAIISAVSFGLPVAIYYGSAAGTAAYARALPYVADEAELAAIALARYPSLRAALVLSIAYSEAQSIATGQPPGIPDMPFGKAGKIKSGRVGGQAEQVSPGPKTSGGSLQTVQRGGAGEKTAARASVSEAVETSSTSARPPSAPRTPQQSAPPATRPAPQAATKATPSPRGGGFVERKILRPVRKALTAAQIGLGSPRLPFGQVEAGTAQARAAPGQIVRGSAGVRARPGAAVEGSTARTAAPEGGVFDFPRPPGRVRGPRQFLQRHGARLEAKPGAIEDIFRRASSPTNPVARRSATGELATLERTLERGDVKKITIVPSKKGTKTQSGESPDFIVEFVDGTKRPLEVTTVASAPRGRVTQKAREFETVVIDKKGRRQVKKTKSKGRLREQTIERRPTQKDYENAVFRKAVPKHPARRKPLQVERDIEGVVPEGIVAIHAPFGKLTDLPMIQGAMGKFSSTIHPRVHRIEFSFGGTPQSASIVFERVGDKFVLVPQ